MASSNQFDLEAPGSRFTMRLAIAFPLGEQWARESEARSGVAKEAIRKELGGQWLEPDPRLGKTRVVDGGLGRGASNWVPVLEWVGIHSAQGVVGMAAGQAVLAGLRRIRQKLSEAKSRQHRPLVSRGMAAFLAMQHVLETTDETSLLNVEFCQEPSVLGGRPPTELTYTGLEPWIVSLVNGSRKTRYVLVVSPEGDIVGCVIAPAGEFDYMFGLLPPVE